MFKSESKPTLVVSKCLRSGATGKPQYLTGSDIFNGHVGIPNFLVYPQGIDVERVEKALVKTLSKYPVLVGRMKKDAQGFQYIDCSDGGADFKVFKWKGNIPKYGVDNPLSKDIEKYHTRFMPWKVVDCDQALVNIEIHEFEDGGAIMSLHGPHTLFDGSSLWNFAADWAKVCHGMDVPQRACDRDAVIKAAEGQPVQTTGVPDGLMSDPPMLQRIAKFAKLGIQAISLKKQTFRIPARQIEAWKQQTQAEMPGVEGNAVSFVAAHCLKTLSPVMKSSADRIFGIVIDLRFKKGLNIPRDYVGCALGYGEARYTREQVEKQSIPALAAACRPAPEHVTTEALFNFLALFERYRQKKAVWKLFWKSAGDTTDAGIILNSSAHFPMYHIDFGRGTPSWYDICGVAFRMLMVVQTPEKDGGIDVHLTALPKELRAYEKATKAFA